MWAAVAAVVLGGVVLGAVCRLSAQLARQKALLKQWQEEAETREKMEEILERVAALSDDELADFLYTGTDKK